MYYELGSPDKVNKFDSSSGCITPTGEVQCTIAQTNGTRLHNVERK
jgi:hypothetical protein